MFLLVDSVVFLFVAQPFSLVQEFVHFWLIQFSLLLLQVEKQVLFFFLFCSSNFLLCLRSAEASCLGSFFASDSFFFFIIFIRENGNLEADDPYFTRAFINGNI